MVDTLADAIKGALVTNWAGAGTAPTFSNSEDDLFPSTANKEYIYVMGYTLRTAIEDINELYANKEHFIKLLVNTSDSSDKEVRLNVLVEETERVLNTTGNVTGYSKVKVVDIDRGVTEKELHVYRALMTVRLNETMVDSATASGSVSGDYSVSGNLTVGGQITTGSLKFSASAAIADAFLDEDDFASDSATGLASQQSIKAYIDAVILTEDTLAEMNDTTIAGLADNHILTYDNATSKWINEAQSALTGVDHDAIANFVANEHIDHTSVTLTAGAGLTGGGTIAANRSFAVGAGTGITVNANDVQTDDSAIVHDSLSGFVANEHIDHSGISVIAGAGMTGGGTIAANRTLNVIGGVGITVNANDIDCDITQYTDALARTACVEDAAYGAGWNADSTHAPSQNAVYDKINAMDTTIAANTTQAEVETIITAELVNGQSIDNAIDSLISTHNVANRHIDHTGVYVYAGTGLTGGGHIGVSRTLNVIGGAGITVNADNIECTITQYTDALARTACVSNTAYAVGWNAVTTIAPSKNAVYDQLVTHYANANAHHAQSHTMNSHSDASLADPGADRIVFWDETSNQVEWLVASTGLAISGNNLNCSITQYTDSLARTACVQDAAYGAGWNGDTTHAPSQNAVYDQLVTHYGNASAHHTAFTAANARAACIIDTAFGAGWNADTTYGASKNALYDAINPLKQLRSHAMNLNIYNGAVFYYGNAMSGAYLPSGDTNAGVTYKVPVPESWVGTTATLSILCAIEHASNTFSWTITVKAIGFAGEAWPGSAIITGDTTHDITGNGTSLYFQVESVSLSGIAAGDVLMVGLASDASNANNLYIMDVWID